MTPATILRDSAIAGLLLSLGGLAWDVETAGAVAAGALGSLLNLFLMWRAVQSASAGVGAVFLARLLFKTAAGALILLVLVAKLPVAPVLVGFCSVMLGLSMRVFTPAGAAHLSPPEQG